MSLSTYNDLKTSVASWLHRTDLTAIIPDLINIAELRIFREVRCRVMEAPLSGVMTSGVVALPTDYLDLKSAYIDASPASALTRSNTAQVYAKYPNRVSEGRPVLIAREGSNFIFGPYPDSAYTVKGIYYAKPTGIETLANDLFLASPDVYLYATLVEASPYLQDDARIQLWETKYAQIVNQLNAEDSREYGSGGGLTVSAG